jgi:hypothetical protein
LIFFSDYRGVFKTRAGKFEKALKELGYSVSVNPTKPRKGAFVITLEGCSEPLVELLDMQRPFTKLRNLEMEPVIEKLKAL